MFEISMLLLLFLNLKQQEKKNQNLSADNNAQIVFTPISKIPIPQEKLYSRGLIILLIIIAFDVILFGLYIFAAWDKCFIFNIMDSSLTSFDI